MGTETEMREQMTNAVSAWVNLNKQFWDQWMTVPGVKDSYSADKLFSQSLDIFNETCKQYAALQGQWAEVMFGGAAAEQQAMSNPWGPTFDQMRAMSEQWMQMQSSMMSSLLSSMRDAQPNVDDTMNMTKQVVGMWQDAVEKTWEAEQEIAEKVSGMAMKSLESSSEEVEKRADEMLETIEQHMTTPSKRKTRGRAA